jgi:hypothetical protein
MTARELLTKAAVVFHSYIKKERPAINSCEKWGLLPSELSRKYQKRFQLFSDAGQVLVYALIKEHARPYETLKEQATVCDFLPRALTVIAMEKPGSSIRDFT